MPPDHRSSTARARSREVLRRLRWPIARRLGVHAWGDELSRLRGPGIEYADVREYQFAEDARLIDWNLTARSDRPWVRESHPDRSLDVWLVVDASRSLDWGTATCLKSDAAFELVGLATLLLTRHGNRVGAIIFDTEVRRICPPTAGRRGRLALLSKVEAADASQTPGGPTNLASALAYAARLISRPSVVIVISDFLVAPGWQRGLKALSLRHEVVAVRITDPREGEIPAIGVVTFEDPETGAQLEVDTGSSALRERFRQAALEQRRQLVAELKQARADLLEVSTGDAVLGQLVAFLRSRAAKRPAGALPQ